MNMLKSLFDDLTPIHDAFERLLHQERRKLKNHNLENYPDLIEKFPGTERTWINRTWQSNTVQPQCWDKLNLNHGQVIHASRSIINQFLDLITQRHKNRTYSKYAMTEANIESTQ